MTLQVIIQPQAAIEIEETYRWIAQRRPLAASKWINGLADAIDSLESNSDRHMPAPESGVFGQVIREFLYDREGGVDRILFVVRAEVIYVLHIRYAAGKPLNPDEI